MRVHRSASIAGKHPWLRAILPHRDLSSDFSKNRADGDDILGDAYEYLMRHFATESGKSKGHFYTPAEVSRIMAKVIGIAVADTGPDTTVLDPTCGSSPLLLKVADEARTPVSLYGPEKDSAIAGLARMNMILHDYPTAEIMQGNTLGNPLFRDGNELALVSSAEDARRFHPREASPGAGRARR